MHNAKSIYAIFYRDKDMTLRKTDGRFSVPCLLLIGFLLCRHENEDAQATELWHLLNPRLDKFISKEHALDVME